MLDTNAIDAGIWQERVSPSMRPPQLFDPKSLLQARENLRAWEHMWDPGVNPTFRPTTNFGTRMRDTRRRAKSMGATPERATTAPRHLVSKLFGYETCLVSGCVWQGRCVCRGTQDPTFPAAMNWTSANFWNGSDYMALAAQPVWSRYREIDIKAV